MSNRTDNLLRLEGFFGGLVAVSAFAILASFLMGDEPNRFVFMTMPWVTVAGTVGYLLVSRAIRRSELNKNG